MLLQNKLHHTFMHDLCVNLNYPHNYDPVVRSISVSMIQLALALLLLSLLALPSLTLHSLTTCLLDPHFFPTARLVLRVMGNLALAAAVDHSLTSTTLLELHLASRLVQLVVLTGGLCTAKEATAQLPSHVVIS